MGDNFMYSSDYQLPLDSYEELILDYPKIGEFEAMGMWQSQSSASHEKLRDEPDPVTFQESKMSTSKVETTTPGDQLQVPPESKNLSAPFQEPKTGLNLPGNGVPDQTGRYVTSVSVPIHALNVSDGGAVSSPPSGLRHNKRRGIKPQIKEESDSKKPRRFPTKFKIEKK